MPDAQDVLIAELEQQPVTDVWGVLAASGMSGVSGNKIFPWVLLITFAAWKQGGGAIQAREMVVRKLVSHEELRAIIDRFEPYDIIHIRARVAEQNSYGTPQALLEEIIGLDSSDMDLTQRALELQQPVTFSDPRFGVFTMDRRVKMYEAEEISWGSIDIRLTLDSDQDEEIRDCLKTANAIWDLQPAWEERMVNFITADLLEIKNEDWLEEDGSELSAEQFKSRITLSSITVRPNGDFDFWYDDDDLFLGHLIHVSGSLSEGPTSVGLSG